MEEFLWIFSAFLFLAVVIGGIIIWSYRTNVNTCQEEYDIFRRRKENEMQEAKGKPDYFDLMSACISEVRHYKDRISGQYTKRVIAKLDMHEEQIVSMYEQLFAKLELEYIGLLSGKKIYVEIEAWVTVLSQMKKSVECIHGKENEKLVALEEKQRKKMKEAFKSLGRRLNQEYNHIVGWIDTTGSYDEIINVLERLVEKYCFFVERFRTKEEDLNEIKEWIEYVKLICYDFKVINQRLKEAPAFYLHNVEYGKCNESLYSKIMEVSKEKIRELFCRCSVSAPEYNIFDYFTVRREEFVACLWYCALRKPFILDGFKNVSSTFFQFNKNTSVCMDVFLAELYYRKQMGADYEVENRVRNFLKGEYEKPIYDISGFVSERGKFSELLTGLASGLMWMGAYSSEKLVLEYMLSVDLPMSPKVQERLHALNSGSGVASKSYAVFSDSERLFFDVSSVSWSDDHYESFLGNLEFEEKLLTYSIGVRSDEKEVSLTTQMKVPDEETIFDKMKEIFFSEYGETVTIEKRKCSVLSGNSQEEINAILLQSLQCLQLGLVVYMTTIGKKMYIKFYTLYMPSASNIEEQRQMMMSLYKMMSPNVAMWENSMRDTVLMAIEQLLNDTKSNNTIIIENDEKEY